MNFINVFYKLLLKKIYFLTNLLFFKNGYKKNKLN
jgi:hypothetical protein